MAQYNIAGFLAQMAIYLPDNNNREISEPDMRQVFTDLVDSMSFKNDTSIITGDREFTTIPVLPLPVESDQDLTITERGVYIFYGSTARTWTIDDDIRGEVEIRTLASVDLALTASLPNSHLGTIYSGTQNQRFLWSPENDLYTY